MSLVTAKNALYIPGRAVRARGSSVMYEFCFAEVELLPNEVWKTLSNGAAVSNRGRYRNTHGLVTVPLPCNGSAYCRVKLDGVQHLFHRLVIKAHGSAQGPIQVEVDHIDGDTKNNNVNNLRWVTRLENIRNSYDTNPNRRSCKLQVFIHEYRHRASDAKPGRL